MHSEGDREALGVLCKRHHPRLMAVAARIAGQDADDAVQDGCLKAFLGAEGFKGESAVTTWLHRIVANAAFDTIRRRRHVAEIADQPWTDPQVAQADTRIDLQRHWRRISRDHQAALLLIELLGYPVAEAARVLGVPEGTLKARAFRARVALGRSLAYGV